MKLYFINSRGDFILLTDNPYFYLINVDGQTSAATDLSTLDMGSTDGDVVNNVKAQPRTVTLDFKVKTGVNVEEAKRYLLNVVKLKKQGTLKWTQNKRTVVLSGIVDSIEMPRWENSVALQLSMHCEQPFWEDFEEVANEISHTIGLHYFTENPNDMLFFPYEGIPLSEYDITRTRTVHNDGDVEVGMDIEVIAYDTCTNPIIRSDNGTFFGIGDGTGARKVVMNKGDYVKISTHKGRKSITLNGVSILGKVKPLSTWLQLEAGDNVLSIDSEEAVTNNVSFTMTYKRRFV